MTDRTVFLILGGIVTWLWLVAYLFGVAFPDEWIKRWWALPAVVTSVVGLLLTIFAAMFLGERLDGDSER